MNGAFVIQFHRCDQGDHYDLMLEKPDALATFQLPAPLAEVTADQPRLVRRLDDHRRAYLTYEGPVSGGRGSVRIAAQGRYEASVATDELWVFELRGAGGGGVFELRRLEGEQYRLTRTPRG